MKTVYLKKGNKSKMKLLSIAIPSYNSEAYMEHCIESLLVGGEEVEILIVNDGSKDRTAEIADAYEAKYPTICRAIHQENGGHGEAVNAGIRNATGLFFKVVDSDDWVDEAAYKQVLAKLREFVDSGVELDMLLSNYVYEKEGAKHKQVMRQTGVPKGKLFTWEDVPHFYKGHYILMHSVIYRTAMLHECGLELPKHTFYVDSIYVYNPMPFVKNMYYLDVDFYRYFIGRSDQSVNESVMIRRMDQQIRVNKLLIEKYKLEELENKHCSQYMYNYVEIITIVSTIMCYISATEEHLKVKEDLWAYIKETNPWLYKKLRHGLMGRLAHIPGEFGRKTCVWVYHVLQKFIGFN